jgi:hypothetical protein
MYYFDILNMAFFGSLTLGWEGNKNGPANREKFKEETHE